MSVVRQSIEWLGCGQKGLVMESVQNATEVFDQVYLDIRQGCWCWPRRWTGLIDPRGPR
ncbi:MAG: hypothetical protein CM1200mP2_50490 [Planctomycetaceae bacterium]|nr:MAG: hypothetical protein CM1200mP2_50490 [Planctomycetaceae bacterium]